MQDTEPPPLPAERESNYIQVNDVSPVYDNYEPKSDTEATGNSASDNNEQENDDDGYMKSINRVNHM